MGKATSDLFLRVYVLFSVINVATQEESGFDKRGSGNYLNQFIPRRTTGLYNSNPNLPFFNFVTTPGFIFTFTPERKQKLNDSEAIPHILTTDGVDHAPPSNNAQNPGQNNAVIPYRMTTIPLGLNVDNVTSFLTKKPVMNENSFTNISTIRNQIKEPGIDSTGYTIGTIDDSKLDGDSDNIEANTEMGRNEDFEQMRALLEYMFYQYDKRMRPRSDQSLTVVIRSSFVPFTVIEMNTQDQIFSINGYFKFHWTDELLQWNPQTYNVTKTVRIPTRTMWLPKIKIDKVTTV